MKTKLTPEQSVERDREYSRKWRKSKKGKAWLADRSAALKAARAAKKTTGGK